MNEQTAYLAPYIYLLASLCLLALAAVLYLRLAGQRRNMLISGLLSAPYAFTSYFFVPAYWSPQRLFVYVCGLEDLIFSFANGVIIWGLIAWTLPQNQGRLRAGGFSPGRYVLPLIPALLGIMVFKNYGAMVMESFVLAGAAFWIYCHWALKGRLLFTSIFGGVAFCLLFSLLLKAVILLVPQVAEWYRPQGLAGMKVWGLPLGEVMWSFFFGSTWPLYIAFVMGWHKQAQPVSAFRGLFTLERWTGGFGRFLPGLVRGRAMTGQAEHFVENIER